jgi:DNA polymerase-3 subunit gamma/tau
MVVGQGHITTTLKNAIAKDQVAQAFLFCGPRGVGKTTCARILAKAINCTNRGADIEPCNHCESCERFNAGASLDIFELDAASNNSVDDIRGLVDKVRVPPAYGGKKVYIIDEVHMLSTAAFNAFLKTLEEPPSYAIFILATTEKHKILPTILSRCQIFDFARIKIDDIVYQLKEVARQENIPAEDEALHVIAQKADGGMRDALSMFDLVSTFSQERAVTYAGAIEHLNVLDYEYYFRLTDALYKGDMESALLIFDEILRKGFDGHLFIAGLSEHLRNLLVSRSEATVQLLEVPEAPRKRYLEQAKAIPASFQLSALNIAGQADGQYKSTRNQRLLIELTLMKIAHLRSAIDLISLPRTTPPTDASVGEKKNQPSVTAVAAEEQPSTPVQNTAPTPAPVHQAPARPSMRALLETPLAALAPVQSVVQAETPAGTLEMVNIPFTEAQVRHAWEAEAHRLEGMNLMRESTAMRMTQVSVEGNNIVFIHPSVAHQQELQRIINKLRPTLIKALNNNAFVFDFRIEEAVSNTEGMLYTDNDKLAYLLTTYPELAQWRAELGLDLM